MRRRNETGAFSVSLAVKDIRSRASSMRNQGFTAVGGNQKQNWLILRNDTTTIGLFQGMFDRNLLTFNLAGTRRATRLESFQDVREIQKVLRIAASRSRPRRMRRPPGRRA